MTELNKANVAYSKKLQLDRQKEKELIVLSWKVKELSDLNETGRCLRSEISQLSNTVQQGNCRWRQDNVPRHLSNIQEKQLLLLQVLLAISAHQHPIF